MHGRIATTRAGAKKNQLSDQIGMAECDFLGLKTTDRYEIRLQTTRSRHRSAGDLPPMKRVGAFRWLTDMTSSTCLSDVERGMGSDRLS